MKSLFPVIAAVVVGGVLGFVLAQLTREAPAPKIADNQTPDMAEAGPTWEEFRQLEARLEQAVEARDRAVASPASDAALEAEIAEQRNARNSAEARVQVLERQLAELQAAAEAPPEGAGTLAVRFGKWADLAEVRDADWGEIGGAAHKMIPMLQELADAMREGKEFSPALGQRIGEQNRTLIAYWARVAGKLPTHADVNGEFTHPINLANMLAAQLEAAGEPLSKQQLEQIAKLGEEYDRRWQAASAGYTEETYKLEKLLDEGELKEWFKAEMLRVCTPSQREIAVPPSIDGLVGLDLYSAGLIFQMNVADLQVSDSERVLAKLKERVSTMYAFDEAIAESAHYVFNDWVVALQNQLAPRPALELSQYRTLELLTSGRAQLKALKVLKSDFVTDEASHKLMKSMVMIIYPRVFAQ